MSTITELDLSCNKLGVIGCQVIAGVLLTNRTLKRLNLSRNTIVGLSRVHNETIGSYSIVGVSALCEALKVNGTLTYLDISLNYLGGLQELGDEGFGDVSILLEEMLSVNTSLQSLNISGNNLSVSDAKKLKSLAEGLGTQGRSLSSLFGLVQGNRTADLSARGLVEGDGVGLHFELYNHPLLTELDLSNNRNFGGRGVRHLYESLALIKARHPLSKLKLRSIVVSEGDEEFSKSVADIIRLALKATIVITELDLSHNVGIFGNKETKRSFNYLKLAIDAAPTLKHVNISYCGISPDTAHCINFSNVSQRFLINLQS